MSRISISAAELEVMQVLWRTPGLGASDVHTALANDKDWSSRTVKTLLARLVEKGALATRADGRRFLYQPLIAEADYKGEAAGRFLDGLFSGRASDLVASLADTRGVSDEDIAELEKLIEALKK